MTIRATAAPTKPIRLRATWSTSWPATSGSRARCSTMFSTPTFRCRARSRPWWCWGWGCRI